MKNSIRPLKQVIYENEIPAGDLRLSGKEVRDITNPCIYFWIRDKKCLYIGKSFGGLSRPLSPRHHVIGLIDQIQTTDEFRFLFVDVSTDEELFGIEQRYIERFQPKYNCHYELTNDTKNKMPGLRDRLSAEEKLATLLRPEVSRGIFLDDPSSNKNSLTLEQCKQRLAEVREVRQAFDDAIRARKLK